MTTKINCIDVDGSDCPMIVTDSLNATIAILAQSLADFAATIEDGYALWATVVGDRITVKAVCSEPGMTAVMDFAKVLEPFHGRFVPQDGDAIDDDADIILACSRCAHAGFDVSMESGLCRKCENRSATP